MKKAAGLILCFAMILSTALAQEPASNVYPFSIEFDPTRNLLMSFATPAGYERFPIKEMTRYMAWLTNLPLKPAHHPQIRWDKQIIKRADSIGGVIDIGIASKNQRDEDFPMQLALEYLRATGQLDDFPIILFKNDTITFQTWLNGKYATDPRGNLLYTKGESREGTVKEFYRYLEYIIYHNTHESLIKNLLPIKEDEIQPGDIFVQLNKDNPDSTGHTAVVLDVCADKAGNTLMLIGWGGSQAQSYHIPKSWPGKGRNWFTLDELKEQLADYGTGQFYRFLSLIYI